MATINVGMKVNRAITGATTVVGNGYAEVTYAAQAYPATGQSSGIHLASPQGQVTKRVFGPGQSIPSSFTTPIAYLNNSGVYNTSTIQWNLLGGYEIINTI